MYAYIIDGKIESLGDEPTGGRSVTTGVWIDKPETGWTPEALAEIGYYQVVQSVAPPTTATTKYESSVTLVGGVPTQQWTEVPLTTEEKEAVNEKTLLGQVKGEVAALTAIRAARRDTLLALDNATINSNPARYIKDLAKWDQDSDRAIARISRLVARDLGSTDVGGA